MNTAANGSTLQDQMNTVRKQLPTILWINLPLTAILAWVYWPVLDHKLILAWVAISVSLTLARLVLVIFFQDKITNNKPAEKLQTILVVNSALSGLFWGSSGYLFLYPASSTTS